ncbi:MAG: TRAP transporter fused permease subunit [Chloroflexi bacterium]|nr:TRAP transporter fused permease subunit [Chloroflexota bacterium]
MAEVEIGQGKPGSKLDLALSIIAVGIAVFYIWTALYGQFEAIVQRSPLFISALVFVFLFGKSGRGWALAYNAVLALLSVVAGIYIVLRAPEIAERIAIGTPLDLTVGSIMILLVLEAVRRTMGLALPILALIFILYALFGPIMPGVLRHAGLGFDMVVTFSALGTDGIYGLPLQVVTSVIIMFMLFSALLRTGGADVFFTEFPHALLGGTRGGPAKMAVVASSLFGSLSGSTVANVTATGMITIPLMKSTGYKPEMAAAIEAAASTGGQIMPPILGVTAFVMADMLGVSYWSIAIAALIPAVLWYVGLFAVVDFEAAKRGLKGLPRNMLPSIKKSLAQGWFLIIPMAVLIYLLASGWSPSKSVLISIGIIILVTFFSKSMRMTPRKLFSGLSEGIKGMAMITVVCALAGMVVWLINMSGLGMTIPFLLVDISRGNQLVLLLLAMIFSVLLSMGLITVAVYIFLAVLVAPTLVQMGVPLLAAHLFIFYYGAMASITPPVALAAYAGAAIAKCDPMKAGWISWKIALPIFFVPFFFVYQPALIMQGPPGEIVLAAVTAIIGVVAFAAMLEGYFFENANVLQRLLFGAGGLALIYPGLVTDLIGLAAIGIPIVYQFVHKRRAEASLAVEGRHLEGSPEAHD